ncbi:hypothetical protein GEV33_013743 [Tenebrio molitor]|uniref:Uncharacterized protein n=1 Tax=Tenebrio molitor TaxID=7067 RepID=A0A8J6LDJ0_TENMO|nr:hypothetical protein GEV33_013743 [Tenebrio molitor]
MHRPETGHHSGGFMAEKANKAAPTVPRHRCSKWGKVEGPDSSLILSVEAENKTSLIDAGEDKKKYGFYLASIYQKVLCRGEGVPGLNVPTRPINMHNSRNKSIPDSGSNRRNDRDPYVSTTAFDLWFVDHSRRSGTSPRTAEMVVRALQLKPKRDFPGPA